MFSLCKTTSNNCLCGPTDSTTKPQASYYKLSNYTPNPTTSYCGLPSSGNSCHKWIWTINGFFLVGNFLLKVGECFKVLILLHDLLCIININKNLQMPLPLAHMQSLPHVQVLPTSNQYQHLLIGSIQTLQLPLGLDQC